MSNLDDELNAALGVPGTTPMPENVPEETIAATLHKPSKSRSKAEQALYDTIKEQVLGDLIKETKSKTAAVAVPELVEFFVNLPVHAGMIRIDGREYYHGFTYKIRADQRASLADIAGKAWAHDEEVRGQRKPFDSYRLTRGL